MLNEQKDRITTPGIHINPKLNKINSRFNWRCHFPGLKMWVFRTYYLTYYRTESIILNGTKINPEALNIEVYRRSLQSGWTVWHHLENEIVFKLLCARHDAHFLNNFPTLGIKWPCFASTVAAFSYTVRIKTTLWTKWPRRNSFYSI